MIEGVSRKARVFAGDSIGRKTDKALNKADVTAAYPEDLRGGISKCKE